VKRALALLLAACSGPAHVQPDGGLPFADAGAWSQPCQISFGHTYVLDSVEILPTGQGLDLNGDGVIDNSLGFLRPLVNPLIDSNVKMGTAIYLFDLENWDGISPDDPNIVVAALTGVDADDPPQPSNNFTGQGQFYVFDSDFDVNCKPLSLSSSASLTGGFLDVVTPVWRFYTPYVSTVNMSHVRTQMQFASDFSSETGMFGASWDVCSMQLTYLFGPTSTVTLLEELLQNATQPDVDVDGDGLEQITFDGTAVTGCVDGDGTKIDGPTCVCDPRIVDGYSVALGIHGVPAKLDGIIEEFP
jgi:hypothetical protein